MYRLLFSALAIVAWIGVPTQAQDVEPAVPGEATVTQRLFSGELVLRLGGGTVDYVEEASIEAVKSDFDAAMVTFGGRYTYVDPTGFKLRGTLHGWVSDTDEEQWKKEGLLVQRNDLIAGGIDLDGAFGLDLLRTSPQELNLWLGLGYLTQHFERSRFRSFDLDGVRESGIDSVDEDYLIGRFSVGLDGAMELTPALTLEGEINYGFVFYNEADNEALGTIDGDGGNTLDLALELAYTLSERDAIGAGLHYRFQELDGDVEQGVVITEEGVIQQVAEWPDNELEMLSLDIFWQHAL